MMGRNWRKDSQEHILRVWRDGCVHSNKISQIAPPVGLDRLFVLTCYSWETMCVYQSDHTGFWRNSSYTNPWLNSLPLLLTIVSNCFVLKRKWSLNESSGHYQGKKWYKSDSFHLSSFIQPKFITKYQTKDIDTFLNPQGWQFQGFLFILFHFINSTRFINCLLYETDSMLGKHNMKINEI